jgi:predicted kinase
MTSRLVLVCGLPGAGKTVVAERLAAERGAAWLSPDLWMQRLGFDPHDDTARLKVEGLQQELAFTLLRLGLDVVLDNGFWTRQERDGIREAARAHGFETELCALDLPADELWRRVERRNGSGTATVHITRQQFESYLPWWQPPTPDELALYDPPRHQNGGSPSETSDGSSGGLGSVV